MRMVLATIGAMGLLIASAGRSQPGVSVRELVAENERLTAELEAALRTIERLEGELAAMHNDRRGLESRVRDAERVLTALRRELAVDRDESAETAAGAPVPADALASPASLLRELRSRYFAAMRSLPDTTTAERERFREQVALWCRLTQRELRGKRTWLVAFDDLVPLRNGRAVARMSVIDEPSGLAIGEPVDVAIPPRFADRVRNDPRFERWELTAVVIAKPRYNEDRQTRGVFEYPPFVGPHVDFDFELDWVALRGWRAAEGEPAEGDGEAEAGAGAEPQPRD